MTEQHWTPANFQSSEWVEGVLQEKIQLHLYPFRHSSRILANANRPHMAVSIVHGVDESKTPGERHLDGFEYFLYPIDIFSLFKFIHNNYLI